MKAFCSSRRQEALEPLPAAFLNPSMNPLAETQELARRFNEDEAVWRRYEHKRALRRLLPSRSPLPDEILDDLDWQAAERECREVRVIGSFHP